MPLLRKRTNPVARQATCHEQRIQPHPTARTLKFSAEGGLSIDGPAYNLRHYSQAYFKATVGVDDTAQARPPDGPMNNLHILSH